MLLPQSYQYPNRSQGADRVGGQLGRDKECPFSGVTKSGRVWRKVPESDARSLDLCIVYICPWLGPSLISRTVSVDVKHHFTWLGDIVQELCESRGGRPGLSVLTSLLVSVDVKLY